MRLGGHTHFESRAQEFLRRVNTRFAGRSVTSAEVTAGVDACLPPCPDELTCSQDALDSALELVASAGVEVWPLEEADVMLARQLHDQHPTLGGERPLPPCKLPAARRKRDYDLRPGPRRRRIEVGGEARMSGTYADRPWGLFPATVHGKPAVVEYDA